MPSQSSASSVAPPTPPQGPARVVAIIVHHRGRAMLQRAITSLLGSRGVELEVVVVSNRCLEPLPEIVESSPRVHRVVSEESLGFSAANNLGVDWVRESLAPAEWYYFVNNDTQSTPSALAELVAACARRPEAAVAGPRLLILGAPTHLNSLGINMTADAWGWDEGIGQKQRDHRPLPPTRPVLAVTGSALLMRASVFEAVGRWTEIYDYYFEDIDLCVKAWKGGWEVLQVPTAVVLHRISASMGVASDRKLYLFWRNRLFLALVHWPADLVMALVWRALVGEILLRRWRDTTLQRRALLGTLRRLGDLLRCRRRHRGPTDWRRFLVPAGSVPVITLPEVPALDDPLTLPARRGTVSPDVPQPEREDVVSQPPNPAHPSADPAEDPPVERERDELGPRSGDDGDAGGAAVLRRASSWIPPSETGRRLLVVGWCPLPFESARMNYAPGTRSWQLASALAAAGHAVCLAVARIPGTGDDDPSKAGATVEVEEYGGVLIVRFDHRTFETPGELERLVDDFRPEALVAAAAQPARRAVEVVGERPLWIDIFGDPMAEAQAKALVETEGHHLGPYSRLLRLLLDRGDAFSAVSERQRWALLGQLGLMGRLSRATAGRELVHAIPVSCEPWGEAEEADGANRPTSPVSISPKPEAPAIEGWRPAESDFVLLWSGGYNTWCDVETLFAALERVLAERASVVFVSTGGAIEGHDESTYDVLRAKVATSPHRDRYHFAGRLPSAEAEAWQRRADLAVVTERRLAERQLGSSGRVQRWLVEGVPLVCAELSELGETVACQRLGRTYPVGDAKALARCLVEAVDDPEEGRRRARRGRDWALEQWSTPRTTEPLRRWAEHPERAPDTRPRGDTTDPPPTDGGELELRCRLAEAQDDLEAMERRLHSSRQAYHDLRGELGRIHQSRMWKTWMTLTAPLAALRRRWGGG